MAFQPKHLGRVFETPVGLAGGAQIGRPTPQNSTDGSGGLTAPINYKEWTIDHEDLTAAATTESIALAGFPTDAAPVACEVFVDEDFSGGSVSALALEVGDAGDVDELLTSTSVFTGVQNTDWIQTDAAARVGKFHREAAYSPAAKFTASSDNVVNLSAGSLRVRIYYMLMPSGTV